MSERIILASKSPRRLELFSKYGIKAKVVPANADENIPEEICEPCEKVKYLANKKAMSVKENFKNGEIVVAADTLVFFGDKIFGKPKSPEEVFEMMTALSGNVHSVISGICVTDGNKTVCEAVETKVHFRTISEEEISLYAKTDEPYDKAGGYGIQSLAGAFVSSIEGDYYNVVGLPVARLLEILKEEFSYDAFRNLCERMAEEK